MNSFEQFLLNMIGMPAGRFFVLLAWAMIGMVVTTLVDVAARDHKSEKSPEGFSFKFFWNDNIRKFLATLIMVIIALRFSPQLFDVEITDFLALIIGIGSDALSLVVKSKMNILKSKK